jgi:hypothetical protein
MGFFTIENYRDTKLRQEMFPGIRNPSITILIIAIFRSSGLASGAHQISEFVALALAFVAACIAARLQLSKRRVEGKVIASATTTTCPMAFTEKATQVIGTMDMKVQIKMLDFLRDLSTNLEQARISSKPLPDFPGTYESRLEKDYRIVWKTDSWPPKQIIVLSVAGNSDHEAAIDSDSFVSA